MYYILISDTLATDKQGCALQFSSREAAQLFADECLGVDYAILSNN